MAYVYGGQRRWESPEHKFDYKMACSGRVEIMLHIFCIVMVCIAALIPAAIALDVISKIQEYIDNNGGTLTLEEPDYHPYTGAIINNEMYTTDGTFDAAGARAAAGWLIFVCSAGIIFHCVVIIARLHSGIIKYMISYSVMVTVISIVLIFAFIAGTVANGIQVESAGSLHTDRCTFQFQDIEVCQDLGTLISCQLACAIVAPVSLFTYGPLLCPVLYGASTVATENKRGPMSPTLQSTSQLTTQSASQPRSAEPAQSGYPPLSAEIVPSAPPQEQTLPSAPVLPSAPPSNLSANEPPFISEHASPSTSKSPPPYESTLREPPAYEVAIASTNV